MGRHTALRVWVMFAEGTLHPFSYNTGCMQGCYVASFNSNLLRGRGLKSQWRLAFL